MIFIFVLALLIFGPRKLPELGRTIGKALAEFRRASTDLRRTVEDEMYEIDRQAQELDRAAREAVSGVNEPPIASGPADADSHTIAPPASAAPDDTSEPQNPSQGDAKPA